MSRPRYITLHDAYGITQRAFNKGRTGHVIRVKNDAIDTMRPYDDGVVRTIIGVHGVFHHVTETEDEIRYMIDNVDSIIHWERNE